MTYVPPVYPTTIPTITDLPDYVDDVDWITAAVFNNLKKEVRAALTELGTLPKGASADVKTRLGLLATKANVLELDNTDVFVPDADYEPATKKYADEHGGDSYPASPAAGDLIYYDGGSWLSLPIGTSGQTLKAGYDPYAKLQSTFDGVDGATAYTDPIQGAYTFVANAQLDTAQKKFGTASILFDGTGDYVTVPDSADWNFGSGDFTIDCWVRYADRTNHLGLWGQGDVSNNFSFFHYNTGASNSLGFYARSSGVCIGSFAVAFAPGLNTWYHIAVVVASSTPYIFINGVNQSITVGTTLGTLADAGGALAIGRSMGAIDYCFNGWIDEVRVSKGIARWTSNFTPPTVAYGLVPQWIT